MARLTLKQQATPKRVVAASVLPIARVLVDTGLSHLDSPYDYLVTENLSAKAKPGVRVRVRFAGRLVDGWIVERRETTDFSGKLTPLTSVVSPEVILTPTLQKTLMEVAHRFAGNLWDVVRTAIPPRHAKVEATPSESSAPHWRPIDEIPGYRALSKFLDNLEKGPRAVLAAAPGRNPFTTLSQIVHHVGNHGRGVLIVVPDERDLRSLETEIGDGVCVLRANLSPSERYRRYLRLSRGVDRVCIGTRAAIFAPITDLSLIVVWDDGDESHYEQHAPGWNTRDVAAIRAHVEKVALLIAGFSVSVDSARLVDMGWAKQIGPDQDENRAPRILVHDDEPVRVTSRTWKVIKEASARGPVLISVARLGYLPGLQCRACKSPALCGCGGPLTQEQGQPAQCRMCGALFEKYTCASCQSSGLRAVQVGIERTVEEIGKAFPQRTIRHSTGERPISRVPHKPMIVVSTQGVEPMTPQGYEAVVILDAYATLFRPTHRAEEEARRRWFNTAALVKPGGEVVIAADAGIPAVQSLIRWSPASAAMREFEQRRELHLPPAWDFGVLTVETLPPELRDQLTEIGEVLGPLPTEQGVRVIVRAPKAVSSRLREVVAQRLARREPTRVRINPYSV